jgi:serine/threonine protein kinase
VLSNLKNKNNKSINKISNDNSASKGKKKHKDKTITPDTKLIYYKLNNNRYNNNLNNSFIKSNDLKNNRNIIEDLNKSYNNIKSKISNNNYKNIVSINLNKKYIDKSSENIFLHSNIYKNVKDNKKISYQTINANSIKKNNKNNSISSTEESATFRGIQTFRDKKPKKSKEKENQTHFSNEQIKNIYDDKEGNYKIKIGEIINNRYEVIKNLGKGTFGNCIKCYDQEKKEFVCIKIIKNLPRYTEQAKAEIDLINYINSTYIKNENIFVQIKNNFVYHEHICIVFELLSNNLYEELQKSNYTGFNISTVRKFAIQLLFGLLILKTKKIIHCDLKPENILLINEGKTRIKIIDFGSSCYTNDNYYVYIQSRFYRAPEVLLGLQYGVEIDMWSLGCILCEIFCGLPIFPGENEYDMLYYIMEYMGIPPREMIFRSPKRRNFFNEKGEPLEQPNSFGKIRKPNKKSLEKFLKRADNDFIDLIKSIFKWKKEERITPEEALKHKWITKNMNDMALSEHFKKINNFMDYDYCCSTFSINEIKSLDFDDNYNDNYYNSNEEDMNFKGTFNCSFNKDSNANYMNNSKYFNYDIEPLEDNSKYNESIFNNSSPRFASKIEYVKNNKNDKK